MSEADKHVHECVVDLSTKLLADLDQWRSEIAFVQKRLDALSGDPTPAEVYSALTPPPLSVDDIEGLPQ